MSKKYPGGLINKTPPTPSGPYQNSTAPGVWTLDQQAYWTKQGLWPTAGNVPPVYVEDVMSTYLYTGNGSTQTITNGIDLAGKGGMVWLKSRSESGMNHHLYDTVRGARFSIYSNSAIEQYNLSSNGSFSPYGAISQFNSDGFFIDGPGYINNKINNSGSTYASWTFREQPKFFDVVTYTGTGGGPSSVAHALGSVPGFLIIKSTSRAGNWICVARRSNGNYALFTANAGLNLTSAANQPDNANVISSGALSATTFDPSWFNSSGAVGNVDNICDNGVTYVAYLFAHNAGGFGLTGTDNVISCGSFTTDASGSALVGPNLGWEPQWVMLKNATSAASGGWWMFDNMRGFTTNGGTNYLQPNTSDAANTFGGATVNLTSTGFTIPSDAFASNQTFIYIAIRRGPMKTPTTGTSVFSPQVQTPPVGANNIMAASSGFPIDWLPTRQKDIVVDWYQTSRLTNNYMSPNTASSESAYQYGFDKMAGVGGGVSGWNAVSAVSYAFRRAPGFFDVVCYMGTGANRTVAHNLTAVPEMMIVKNRSDSWNWAVYHSALGNTKFTLLDSSGQPVTQATVWNDTSPTASVFTVGSAGYTNASANNYVAYLFATCLGVSKVGSYTGTGALQTINCGFASGARFVLVKRSETGFTGNWYVWDSARGISSGNDPYLLMNSTAAEVTGTNYVDTTAVGFQVTAAAPAELNAVGGTYIFLAIA